MSKPYKFGVLGHNISYSRSGDIFDAMCRHVGIEAEFRVVSVEPSELHTALGWVRSKGFTGLSVTIPFKESIVRFMDTLNPVALALRAVNAVAITDGGLIGSNTDRAGCNEALRPHSGLLRDGRATILGCGGAARAVVYSLTTDYGMDDILVLGRSQSKLQEFHKLLSSCTSERAISIGLLSEYDQAEMSRRDVIINCTPLGGPNHPNQSPLPASFDWSMTRLYFDLNYNEGIKIVSEARDAGVTALDGSTMLVAQAARSLQEWTGMEADVEAVHREVFGEK